MTKLIRDKRTGIYHTEDGQYQITKGAVGWNVYEKEDRRTWINWVYSFSANTLKEVRDSL